MDSDGQNPTRLTDEVVRPDWSPDGHLHLPVYRDVGVKAWNYLRMDADGKDRKLSPLAGNNTSQRGRQTVRGLHLQTLDGGGNPILRDRQ